MKLKKLLDENKIILSDGAMGTMLSQAGFDLGKNTSVVSLECPRRVEEIHTAYFEAGSDIVFTNTFSASPLKLEKLGYSEKEVIPAAVNCAKRAAARFGGLVGLDIGPLGEMISPIGSLEFDEAVKLFADQIQCAEGVDFIAVETMMDLQEARAALIAAKMTINLPVMVTMTFEANGRTLMGSSIPSMALTLESLGADVIGFNCSVGPAQMIEMVLTLAGLTSLPIAVKPNAGLPDSNGNYNLDEQQFLRAAQSLADAGARVIGGCCGTGPRHIRALAQALKCKKVAKRDTKAIDALCSGSRLVDLERPIIVGGRLLESDREISDAWAKGDFDFLADTAIEQAQQGASAIGLEIPKTASERSAQQAVESIQMACSLPFVFLAHDAGMADALLRVACGRNALLVPGFGPLDALLVKSAKTYGGAVIMPALPRGFDSSQKTCESVKIANRAVWFRNEECATADKIDEAIRSGLKIIISGAQISEITARLEKIRLG